MANFICKATFMYFRGLFFFYFLCHFTLSTDLNFSCILTASFYSHRSSVLEYLTVNEEKLPWPTVFSVTPIQACYRDFPRAQRSVPDWLQLFGEPCATLCSDRKPFQYVDLRNDEWQAHSAVQWDNETITQRPEPKRRSSFKKHHLILPTKVFMVLQDLQFATLKWKNTWK